MKKLLNLPILISLVIGNVIGTGIYLLPASLAVYGTLALWGWIFTSCGAILLALTFAHLNKRFPQTGGPYVYCKQAFGHLTGFIIAYIYWLSNLVSIAGLTVATIAYSGFLWPTLQANNPAYNQWITLATELIVVWLFTLINLISLRVAGVLQIVLTAIKILPLLLIIIVGLIYIPFEQLFQFNYPTTNYWQALSSAAALTFWAFIGLEAATIPAENTTNTRAVFLATVLGTVIAAIIYIASTLVILNLIPNAKLQQSQFPFAEVGNILFGSPAGLLITLCAIISGLGALNVCILVQGQIVFAAARDHLFPKRFAKLSKNEVPVAGQLLSSSIATLFLTMTIQKTLLEQFNQIALLAGLLTLITYFVTMLAEVKFNLAENRAFYAIFFSKSFLISLFAAFYAAWMISHFEAFFLLIALALFLIAIPIYYFGVRGNIDELSK